MKKILVVATGWHFSSHFYEKMSQQIVPNGWEVDYYCVAHRMPEDENTIKEKDGVRNFNEGSFLDELDQMMYEHPITTQEIEDFGWEFMLEENTVGDMECFNQWAEHYDYKEYDIILITHDDNFILSDKIFVDVVSEETELYKPLTETRVGRDQFKIDLMKNKNDWYFLDNGYSENIPKAFTPRGSFSFYKKEFIDILPNNKFDMSDRGKAVLTREGRTDSIGYEGILSWNSPVGTLRDWLYEKDLIEDVRWFSKTKRISKYCIEGERGLIGGYNAGENYLQNLIKKMEDLGWTE